MAPAVLSEQLREEVASNAKAVDKGELPARYVLDRLGQAGLIGPNHEQSANLIRELAAEDLSVGFTTWATRMTYEYLVQADTEYSADLAAQLASGTRPGVTGMAGAFKAAAGVGECDLTAQATDDGFIINGKLGWASNLYDDAIFVTAACTEDGERILFAFEAGHEGVEFGKPFGLLGLNSTASAWVSFDSVHIPSTQVLTQDFDTFMKKVRPVFVVMQVAECIGVAEASATAARGKLDGMKATFTQDLDEVDEALASVISRQQDTLDAITSGEAINAVELLTLRLDAADVAVRAANIEVRVAGGAGYASSSPASRRYREASFLPVQSPSEAQLRFELERAREEAK